LRGFDSRRLHFSPLRLGQEALLAKLDEIRDEIRRLRKTIEEGSHSGR